MCANIPRRQLVKSEKGSGRTKVALKPGHSLLDWIRLGSAPGEDLSGRGGAPPQPITRQQLAQHKTTSDVWLAISACITFDDIPVPPANGGLNGVVVRIPDYHAIGPGFDSLRGKVYNVTRYLDFHPGGVDEIMKGAGMDATSLFNKVHPWVNYESMLKRCFVGTLRQHQDSLDLADCFADSNSDRGGGLTIVDVPPDKNSCSSTPATSPVSPDSNGAIVTRNNKSRGRTSRAQNILIRADWYQQLSYVSLVFYTRQPTNKIHVDYTEDKELWVELGDGCWTGWEVNRCVRWPPQVTVSPTKLEVRLNKMQTLLWDDLSILEPPRKGGIVECGRKSTGHCPVSVFSSTRLTHNVYLIAVRYLDRVYNYIPIGHHVFLKTNIGGNIVERAYTPVCGLLEAFDPGLVWLVVKRYPDGVFSSWLTGVSAGQPVDLQLSRPQGLFSTADLMSAAMVSPPATLTLLAAGSGITPMVRLIVWALANTNSVSYLALYTDKGVTWNSHVT
ncbi:hypothetical protein AAG570_002569 [Ranatra chinensis]|uniref:Cytochrome-b5 reductase n=1 Tax=Ranatra chinensis TaxID=642074 RepID=A0ABD0Y8V2_9HEMI